MYLLLQVHKYLKLFADYLPLCALPDCTIVDAIHASFHPIFFYLSTILVYSNVTT